MTDPRVLVRLDVVIGLLGLLAVLAAIQVVIEAPDVGLPTVLLLAVASAFAAYRYRQVYVDALA